MKKLRFFFTEILCLTFGVFALTSCDDDDPAPLSAVVDVYIQDLKTDAGVKYGVVINATANYEIKTATVTAPGTDGKTYQLTATSNKRSFVFVPGTTDYTTELPVKGNYSYEITSVAGDKITGTDAVGEEKLAPIAIKTATMSGQKLKVTWDKLNGADSYMVRLYSSDKSELLFSGSLLTSDKTEFEFGKSTATWASGKSPVANTNYVVELIGIKFETGVTAGKTDNIQFISLDTKTIKWE